MSSRALPERPWVKGDRGGADMVTKSQYVLLAMLALGATAIAGAPPASVTSIHQEVDFYSSPIAAANAAILYDALLDEKQVGAFGGAPARIDRTPGGPFKTSVRPLPLPARRIVRAWRRGRCPAGVYSIVRFELTETDSGVHLVLEQTGFPPEDREALTANWPKKYWEPMRKLLYLTLP